MIKIKYSNLNYLIDCKLPNSRVQVLKSKCEKIVKQINSGKINEHTLFILIKHSKMIYNEIQRNYNIPSISPPSH